MYPVDTKIYVAGEKRPYVVQASDKRFAIMTKRHFSTVLYSVLDKEKRIRGTDNLVFGLGYETRADCVDALAEFTSDRVAVSYRNRVALDVHGADYEITRVVLVDGTAGLTPLEIFKNETAN